MKHHLLNLFVTYLIADVFVWSSPLLILINNENEILKISSGLTTVFEYNHEKVDSRIIVCRGVRSPLSKWSPFFGNHPIYTKVLTLTQTALGIYLRIL